MSKRDVLTALFMYLVSAELVVTGLSLVFDSQVLFLVGQPLIVGLLVAVAALTFGSQNKDKD